MAHLLVEASRLITGAKNNRSRASDKSACPDELKEAATVSLSAELLVDPDHSHRHISSPKAMTPRGCHDHF